MRAAELRSVEVEDVLDVGLGDEAYEKLADGGGAYRTNQLPVRAIIGEPGLALVAIRGGLVHSGALVMIAVVAGLISLYATT
jgi:hypothetical protein